MFKNFFTKNKPADGPVKPGTATRRELIRREAVIGGQLFGPVPSGHLRQFFCLDKHCWVWHEEWIDQKTGQRQVLTTRYEIRDTGILKAQGDQAYHFLEPEEAKNLSDAIKLYYQQVMKQVYGRSVTI
ncbi:MAG TPA: hypothetical protein VF996_01985 [Candidatus Saccharimonadales bacterium]|jgi:hypothetical protein